MVPYTYTEIFLSMGTDRKRCPGYFKLRSNMAALIFWFPMNDSEDYKAVNYVKLWERQSNLDNRQDLGDKYVIIVNGFNKKNEKLGITP